MHREADMRGDEIVMSSLSIPLAQIRPIFSTLSPEQIRARAEAIFPSLLQIDRASRPEERALAVSALKDRLSVELAQDRTF
jgi:hypothetical protein